MIDCLSENQSFDSVCSEVSIRRRNYYRMPKGKKLNALMLMHEDKGQNAVLPIWNSNFCQTLLHCKIKILKANKTPRKSAEHFWKASALKAIATPPHQFLSGTTFDFLTRKPGKFIQFDGGISESKFLSISEQKHWKLKKRYAFTSLLKMCKF